MEKVETISWENKSKLCSLSNEDLVIEFIELAYEHFHSFDIQAWDMFITGLDLGSDQINKDNLELKDILSYYNKNEEIELNLGLRSNIRFSMLEELLK